MLRKPGLLNRSVLGVGLVEIMVGLAIGSFAAIIMLQVFALSEERKRTTTGGGDAQSNGVIVFNQLQRDIAQAGHGVSAVDLFNCNTTWALPSGGSINAPVRIAPVTINPATIPAGDPNTDTLLVMYGNTDGQPQGNPIMGQAGAVNTVQMPSSFVVGDRVIAAPAAPAICAANLVLNRVTETAATTVTLATAAVANTLYNLGPSPNVLAYAIRNGNLTVCDYIANDCGIAANTGNPAIWTPIGNNIVSMRAVYWRDTTVPNMDGIPDGDGHDQGTPNTACGWARVSAISLALVARSTQFSKDIVTTTASNAPSPANAPTWSENAAAPIIGPVGTLGPDASADEPWKHYRYKVFEAVIPMRNVGWMGVTPGC